MRIYRIKYYLDSIRLPLLARIAKCIYTIQLNPAEACSATTGVDSVTWNDLISLVEGNPNEFDSRVYRAYKEERDRMEGSNFCQEIAVLRAVSEIICWTFSQKASFSEEKVRDAYKTAFDHYPSRWDSMLNTTASDCFRNALYAADANRPSDSGTSVT